MVTQSLHLLQTLPFSTSTTRATCCKSDGVERRAPHGQQQPPCVTVSRSYSSKRRSSLFKIRAAQDAGTQAAPSSPSAAVELGLSLFRKGRVRDALAQFDTALAMNPEPEEAQAALYNKACCHAKREEEQLASEALQKALRDYGLKFSVILNDPDLASFRGTQEFKQLQDEARKGGQNVGQGFRRDLKLIGEVQAPFRAVRKTLYIVFVAAAGISTVVNGPRLYRAIQGGENAPDIWETLQNLGINIAGIVVLVALFLWDTRKEEEQLAKISRDETLSRLPLRLSGNRVVELVQLRESTRPVRFYSNHICVSIHQGNYQMVSKEAASIGVDLSIFGICCICPWNRLFWLATKMLSQKQFNKLQSSALNCLNEEFCWSL